ncbi:MAG: hypothetical protein OEZ22_08850 [Spirochaetia bacterium]|nr:hypothetical protein [Spirochaetia bacterium]
MANCTVPIVPGAHPINPSNLRPILSFMAGLVFMAEGHASEGYLCPLGYSCPKGIASIR